VFVRGWAPTIHWAAGPVGRWIVQGPWKRAGLKTEIEYGHFVFCFLCSVRFPEWEWGPGQRPLPRAQKKYHLILIMVYFSFGKPTLAAWGAPSGTRPLRGSAEEGPSGRGHGPIGKPTGADSFAKSAPGHHGTSMHDRERTDNEL